MEKIKLGISSCLLGENVRYDGSHKLDHFLHDTLGRYVNWVPVCPEVEYGLPVPREAMRLVGDSSAPRLVTRKTRVDHTAGMKKWARSRLAGLEAEDLCGFIFKSRSPSSGLKRVKVYTDAGMPGKSGTGIFAKAFVQHFPLLPVEDDGRLRDPSLRENFIERVFVSSRWKDFLRSGASRKGLVDFHTDHKLLILAHSPKHYTSLGRIVAQMKERSSKKVLDEYFTLFMQGLSLLATIKKNTNVLMHIAGYFKKVLTPAEKKELLDIISHYHRGLVPLIVPTTLMNHYTRKYENSYLKRQFYLNPHPLELMLRNHV